jgi:hypothetical protein
MYLILAFVGLGILTHAAGFSSVLLSGAKATTEVGGAISGTSSKAGSSGSFNLGNGQSFSVG